MLPAFLSAYLPQDDPRPGLRRDLLRWVSTLYSYKGGSDSPNRVEPVAVAGRMPPWEIFDARWALTYLPNFVAANLNKARKNLALSSIPDRFLRAQSWPYDLLFPWWSPKPPQAYSFERDDDFAWRRIAGPNALLIERVRDVTDLVARMPELTDAHLSSAVGASTTIAAEVASENLFVLDFRDFAKALSRTSWKQGRDSRFREKYLPAPVLVLCQRPASPGVRCELRPVAITIDQPGTTPNPLYTPADGEGWRVAKLFVEIADDNWHFAYGHLFRSHFFMEAVALAMPRNLSMRHPVAMLLRPHTRFTLFTNVAAYLNFARPGWLYDSMYAGTLEDSRDLLRHAHSLVPMRELRVSEDLARRGVATSMRVYPYREDALEWEKVLDDFAGAFVQAFYRTDDDVIGDPELQAFITELIDPRRGALHGLLRGSRLETREELASVLSHMLFRAGPGHASQHFSMMDWYVYAPMMTEAAHAPPPQSREEATRARFFATLPDPKRALENLFQTQIGDYRYDRFGSYGAYPLAYVEQARPAITKLRADLAALESRIVARDALRPISYPYLRPTRVPNSVNI